MKVFGVDVKQKNKGYFGIRKCEVCGGLRDVNLIEVSGCEKFLCVPIKKLGIRRFLMCTTCGACFEINEDLWNYYSQYKFRFDKATTDQVISALNSISEDLAKNDICLKFEDKASQHSINMIFNNLCKKFNNPENLSEIISVYFS